MTITMCPTQHKWFGLFVRGMENRMGCVSQRNQPLGPGVIPLLLQMVQEDAEGEEVGVAAGLIKFGTAIALATCASLRRSEVFLLERGSPI